MSYSVRTGLLTLNADLGDLDQALRWSVLNRCDEVERPLLAELFQRCFGRNLVQTQPAQGSLY